MRHVRPSGRSPAHLALALGLAALAAGAAPQDPGSGNSSQNAARRDAPAAGSRAQDAARRDGPATAGNASGAARTDADGIPVAPPVIGLHQIDRYDAMKQLQEAVEKDPKSVADWVMLGEISHELAMDAPADKAAEYLNTSVQAFEKAKALSPDNPALTAAVKFAKDQQAGVDAFEKSRDLATTTYLAARRRDLVATDYTPYVRVYGSPQPPITVRSRPGPGGATGVGAGGSLNAATATGTGTTGGTATGRGAVGTTDVPATSAAATATTTGDDRGRAPNSAQPVTAGNTLSASGSRATDTSNFGTVQDYSRGNANAGGQTISPGATYQPLYVPGGQAYTYQQYSNQYYPPGVLNVPPGVAPMSLQRSIPQATPNAFERSVLDRGAAPAPGTTPRPTPTTTRPGPGASLGTGTGTGTGIPGDTAKARAADAPPPAPAPAVRPPVR